MMSRRVESAIQALGSATGERYWGYFKKISMLRWHAGLFVGLSMEDANIRRLIDVTHRQYPEIRNYTILKKI
jgi:hypothetical protein